MQHLNLDPRLVRSVLNEARLQGRLLTPRSDGFFATLDSLGVSLFAVLREALSRTPGRLFAVTDGFDRGCYFLSEAGQDAFIASKAARDARSDAFLEQPAIIISHAREDRRLATAIAKALARRTVVSMLEQDNNAPQDPFWRIRMREALRRGLIFAPILSADYGRRNGADATARAVLRDLDRLTDDAWGAPIRPILIGAETELSTIGALLARFPALNLEAAAEPGARFSFFGRRSGGRRSEKAAEWLAAIVQRDAAALTQAGANTSIETKSPLILAQLTAEAKAGWRTARPALAQPDAFDEKASPSEGLRLQQEGWHLYALGHFAMLYLNGEEPSADGWMAESLEALGYKSAALTCYFFARNRMLGEKRSFEQETRESVRDAAAMKAVYSEDARRRVAQGCARLWRYAGLAAKLHVTRIAQNFAEAPRRLETPPIPPTWLPLDSRSHAAIGTEETLWIQADEHYDAGDLGYAEALMLALTQRGDETSALTATLAAARLAAEAGKTARALALLTLGFDAEPDNEDTRAALRQALRVAEAMKLTHHSLTQL